MLHMEEKQSRWKTSLAAGFCHANGVYDTNKFIGGPVLWNYKLHYCHAEVLSLNATEGQKASKIKFPYWDGSLQKKKKTKKRGSELSFIFRVHLPANGACGKKMSNKEVPFPFLASLTVKPSTQRAFFWRTTLTKTAEHNISAPSNKRNCSEKEGRGASSHIKSKQNSSTAQTPTKHHSPEDWESWDQCDWFISCC